MSRRAGPARLRVLEVATLLAAAGLLARLVVVQVIDHERYRERAERQWRHREVLAPERGNIYDREGRPLALSAMTWRIGVATSQVKDPARLARILAGPLRQGTAEVEARLRQGRGRHVVLAREAVLRRGELDTLRIQEAVTLERISDRIYPLDGAGASLIGFHHEDGRGQAVATGLERSLGARLAGTPGAAWRLDTARAGQSLGTVVLEEPVHGHHLVLSLDADVQRICEEELTRAIAECSARGGAALVLDPRTGDVLAAAASPLIRDRSLQGGDPAVWNNQVLTGIYEPGSVFKVFTAALLLRQGAVDSATVFDCSNDDFGSFHIHNSEGHSYGPLNLMDAFAKSSNIWFARAIGRLDRDEVYHGYADFGFGSRARAPYAAEPAGILPKPSRWSVRTQATLAIGQEVAVTPLQLALAGCAIANGGELPAPRFVREVRDHEQRLVERTEPAMVRRVLSPAQARLVRLAMARAVGHGTGKAAALPWARVGGKTGTAQKAEPGRGYLPGKYVASFLGCVPIDDPRLVILAIIDEPDAAHHYASQSAAPLFARLAEGIRQSTDWLTGVAGPDPALKMASRPIPSATVPDVLYLSPANAAVELGAAGLVLGGDPRGGWVVEQVPGAGARCAPGDTVWVTVAGRTAGPRLAGQVCPDLRGLSNRQVTRLAARLGLPLQVRGAGYVARQEPAPGAPMDSVVAVTVSMEPRWN